MAPIATEYNSGAVAMPQAPCDVVRQEASKYDWDVNIIGAISESESGCEAWSVGDNYVIAGIYAPSCGVLQVRTLAGRPDCESLKDIPTNVRAAYQVWTEQGYQAWTKYQTGEYKEYLQ